MQVIEEKLTALNTNLLWLSKCAWEMKDECSRQMESIESDLTFFRHHGMKADKFTS